MAKVQKLRNNEYYDMQTAMDNLYEESKKGCTFTNLMPLIIEEDNILLAYRNIKKNKGGHTSGVDGYTIKDAGKLSKDKLVKMVRSKLQNYHPNAVKRVEIPKPNGKTRPLGIPTIMDRIIQQCILHIIRTKYSR